MRTGNIIPVLAAVANMASAGLVFVDNKCSTTLYFISYYNGTDNGIVSTPDSPILISGQMLPGATPGYTEDQRMSYSSFIRERSEC